MRKLFRTFFISSQCRHVGDAEMEEIWVTSAVGFKRSLGHQTNIHVQTVRELQPPPVQERSAGWVLPGQVRPHPLGQGGALQVSCQGQLSRGRGV